MPDLSAYENGSASPVVGREAPTLMNTGGRRFMPDPSFGNRTLLTFPWH
jgi:hypothetical protein